MKGDPVSTLLLRVIWERRTAFYDEAVRRDIVTVDQVERLISLHHERDVEQERREEAEP